MAARDPIVFTLVLQLAALGSANKWEVPWHSSDSNLVPPLPIAAPKSDNAQCRQDSIRLIEALANETLWAEEMWDASAKTPVGIISGSRFQMGDFDECLSVAGPIEAQYCLMDVKIKVPPGHNTTDPFTLYYDPNGSLWDKMYYRGSPFKIRIDELKWAVCVPASCSGQEIVSSIQEHLASINYTKITVGISPRMCTVKNRYYDQYFTSDILFCILMFTLIGLTFLATVYDFSVCDGQKEWKWNSRGRAADLLMCFSARRAVQSMVRRRGEVNNLDFRPLCGITFICYVLITAGHRYGFRYGGPIQNAVVNEQIYYSPIILIFINHMDMFVDVFFTISGCLAVYFVLQRMETHKVRFFEIIIVRYFRLTPVYAITLFFYATLYYKMGSGPLWNSMVGLDMENCKEVWWTNLLYINNYVHADKLCGFHTWFMPCEFQFGILIIPLCYLYHSKPKLGIKVAYAALAMAIILPGWTTWTERLNGNLIFNAKFFISPGEDEYWQKFYMKTWTRAGPYIIGSILGYTLHHTSQRLSHSRTWVYFICGSLIMFVSWGSGIYFYNPRTEYNRLISSLYGACIRSVWSAGISLVLYSLLNGSRTCVHSILSWHPFAPLATIGFNVYLLNTIVPVVSTASLRENDHTSIIKYAMNVFGDLGIDMSVGFLLYLCAEKPFMQLGLNLSKILENKPKPEQADLSHLGHDNKVKVSTEHL